jgi:phospholipid transport system substrate-binding protein
MRIRLLTAVLLATLFWPAVAVLAQDNVPVAAADAAATTAVVQSLDDALLATMKEGAKLGYSGRVAKLTPIVDQAFDLPFMTRFIIGTDWNTLSPDQQHEMLASFRRFTIGTYASHFDEYNGESFEITGQPLAQRDDVMVQTKLVPAKGDPIKLNYLLRKGDKATNDGKWQIIDVFLEGTVSEIATQRADFQQVLTAGGVDGLISKLDTKTAALATDPAAPSAP